MFKNRKLIFMIFSLACFIAMGVCLIVDVAITGQITWGAYPLLSIPFGWMVVSPLLIKKHGITLSICVLTLVVLPYLYLIEKITPVSGWFSPIGVPSAITGIILGWVVYFLFRFTRINIWYKSAVSFFLAGVIASPIINHFVDVFTGESSFLSNIINVFSCIIVSAILGIIGYRKNEAKKTENIQQMQEDKNDNY